MSKKINSWFVPKSQDFSKLNGKWKGWKDGKLMYSFSFSKRHFQVFRLNPNRSALFKTL